MLIMVIFQFLEIMINIEKLKFHILEVSGNHYLLWFLDIELHLQGLDIIELLALNGKANNQDKANVLIFIRRHLHESLKV